MEEKILTMRPFKYLKMDKWCLNDRVVGFSMRLEDFNRTVALGAQQQKKKKSIATQYCVEDLVPRAQSPSVFSAEFRKQR